MNKKDFTQFNKHKEIMPDLYKNVLYETLSLEFLLDNGLVIEFRRYIEDKGYTWHDVL